MSLRVPTPSPPVRAKPEKVPGCGYSGTCRPGAGRCPALMIPARRSTRRRLAGGRDVAAREYRRALRVDPHFVRARVNLGNACVRLGRDAAAEQCYRRSLRDAPADADALNNLAVVLTRRGVKLAEAEALARRAVDARDDSTTRATLAEVRAARAAPRR